MRSGPRDTTDDNDDNAEMDVQEREPRLAIEVT